MAGSRNRTSRTDRRRLNPTRNRKPPPLPRQSPAGLFVSAHDCLGKALNERTLETDPDHVREVSLIQCLSSGFLWAFGNYFLRRLRSGFRLRSTRFPDSLTRRLKDLSETDPAQDSPSLNPAVRLSFRSCVPPLIEGMISMGESLRVSGVGSFSGVGSDLRSRGSAKKFSRRRRRPAIGLEGVCRGKSLADGSRFGRRPFIISCPILWAAGNGNKNPLPPTLGSGDIGHIFQQENGCIIPTVGTHCQESDERSWRWRRRHRR